MATCYMKADGSCHSRIWFAKAGRGINQYIGISDMVDRQRNIGYKKSKL